MSNNNSMDYILTHSSGKELEIGLSCRFPNSFFHNSNEYGLIAILSFADFIHEQSMAIRTKIASTMHRFAKFLAIEDNGNFEILKGESSLLELFHIIPPHFLIAYTMHQ